jgi:hypothetical protein
MASVHENTRNLILEKLEGEVWMPLLTLKCRCFGYRHVRKRLLRWSVREMLLLREERVNDATKLLQRVTSEVKAQLEHRRDEEQAKPAPKRVPSHALNRRFLDPRPERKVSTQRWVPGDSPIGLVSKSFELTTFAQEPPLFKALRDIGKRMDLVHAHQGRSGHYVDDWYTHPYHVANDELEPLIQRLSPQEWQRLAVEREANEDTEVTLEWTRNETAVSRAVKSLVSEGILVTEVREQGKCVRRVG